MVRVTLIHDLVTTFIVVRDRFTTNGYALPVSVNLGGILRRSDPLGRIYDWIPSGDLLGSVSRVPYLEELFMERNTEKIKLARIVLKRLQTP